MASTAPSKPLMLTAAEKDGWAYGLKVLAGEVTVEEAGARWLEWADASHASGVWWIKRFDQTGADRSA